MNEPNQRTFAELMRKPNIDEATEKYQKLGARIREELSNSVSDLDNWEKVNDGSESGCGADIDGESRGLPLYGVRRNLPDEKWDRAVKIVAGVANDYGFDRNPLVLRDVPGEHHVAFHNTSDDSRITFGTAKNTSFRISVGCHLTAEAKERGRPSS